MNTFYTWLAALAAGALGAMGFGGGGVLILYLTLVLGISQQAAQGINLIFFIPIAALATLIYAIKRKLSFKTVLPLVLFGIPGTVAGWWLGGVIDPGLCGKIFGLCLVALGVKELFSKK